MTVSDLLRQSRAAHLEYAQTAAVYRDGNWMQGDLTAAKASLERAQTLRQQADAADPAHSDLEWKKDRAPHADILAFYAERIGALSRG